jgi:hypothetical protein
MSPIKPENAAKYPPDWIQIRADVLFVAGNHCQGTPQHPDCRAANGEPHPETGSRVVLTIAHMDHDEENSDRRNLRALCQRCHLHWDHGQHLANAAATRRGRKQMADLFAEARP